MRAVYFFAIGLLFGAGCTTDLEGYAWDVTLTGGEPGTDSCNIGSERPYEDTFSYVLNFSGADVSLGLLIDREVFGFASGTLAGCDVSYNSVVWQEIRESGDLLWQLEGEATMRQGGATCNLEDGVDWTGYEEITVIDSSDPDIPVGCFYRMQATGTFVGEL